MFFSRRFFPYFVVQCLGALNDNVFKNTLLLMVAWASINDLPMPIDVFVNLAAALFILPFLLFSAHAGYIADGHDKAWLIRWLKAIELVLMLAGAVAIMTHSYVWMLVLLFLMGTQSAYFGPVKYALLPQSLASSELVRGNAWVEVGTFLAILAGTIGAGIMMASNHAAVLSASAVAVFGAIGWLASLAIAPLPPLAAASANSHQGYWRLLQSVKAQSNIFTAVLGISWFWFVGAIYLTQFPNFTRLFLHANPGVVSLLLALFSIGIASGSFMCVKLAKGQIELGLLPIGLLGLAVFGLDLVWAVQGVTPLANGELYVASYFIQSSSHWRLMVDLFMVGLSGGIYIVPLYSFIQAEARPSERAQVIAANNILNAIFMIASALVAIVLLQVLELSIVQLFAITALLNLPVIYLLCLTKPKFKRAALRYLRGSNR
ncbi:MFS transporter [Shewanella sp. SNU WT4]|uniref:MFS transporter n=1 Tax=Shewanella sp. SNU WT4 TaxID=2590015 RepID=UPI00112DC576|nr:MFS transporter [Shewanella sp. SNU WT4]QDF65387.1 MFS transporter [Shewanella sp. SNU WT4]